MKKALLIGSITTDVTLMVDHLPHVEEDVNVHGETMRPGGCIFNIASVFRVKQLPYELCYALGKGIFAKFLVEELSKRQMPAGYQSDEENGACYCLVDKEGNRTFLAVHGAEYHFKEEMFSSLDPAQYAVVYAGGIDIEEESGENILVCLEHMYACGVTVVFAPGPRIGYLSKERIKRLLALRPVLHMNYREGMTLAKCMGFRCSTKEEVVRSLNAMTNGVVVLTDGASPLTYCDGNGEVYQLLTEPVQQVDGTGAGDCHCGTLLCGLVENKDLHETMQEANYIASLVVGKQGGELCLTDIHSSNVKV